MEQVFKIILGEIIKRKRKYIPSVVLTGSRFDEYTCKYHIHNIDRTINQQEKFIFNNTCRKINVDDYEKDGTVQQQKFIFNNNTSGIINFDDYKKELLYLKLFTKNIEKPISTEWKHLIKSTTIIKINDAVDKVFYMYIKLCIKDYCNSSDDNNILRYRIVYSSCFDDLVNFIYKPKQIPNFLDSNAFVSNEDKTIEQYTIIKNYKEMFIKKINYDNTIIVVDLKKNTLTTTILGKTYSTTYKIKKDKCFVNDIITKGSDTISIRIFHWINGVDISITNHNQTLKEFFLYTK